MAWDGLPLWRKILNAAIVLALFLAAVWFVFYAIDLRGDADSVRQGFRDTASGR